MTSKKSKRMQKRIQISAVLLLFAFVGLASRATYLSLFDQRGAARGRAQTQSHVELAAYRGVIFDRYGKELAITTNAPSIYANPRQVDDPSKIAHLLNKPISEIENRLRTSARFVFLDRWVSEQTAKQIEALGLPGVGTIREPRRRYPLGELGAQVIGFSNLDGAGVRGIENLEDHWLRGNRRVVAIERDARRRALAQSRLDPSSAMGGEISLTIDAGAQASVEEALGKAIQSSGARGGLVVLIEPATGDILALAERPTFNPNMFRDFKYSSTRARSWSDAFEPGSSMKPFLVAAALEQGTIDPTSQIDCEGGSFTIPGKTLRDLKPRDVISVSDVLRYSSNIGAVKIGFGLGRRQHHAMLRAFGFGSKTGGSFPEESAGLLRSWQNWRPVDHATISFGHGISVTAVQLAAATATLANGGIWQQPRLVRARRLQTNNWELEVRSKSRRVVQEAVAVRVLEMLEEVVAPGGTGHLAALSGVRVAGKTGTAQKYNPSTGQYSDDRFLAWFVGIVSTKKPLFVAVVMLDEPGAKAHTGGAVAAPLFAQIASDELARRGIVPSSVSQAQNITINQANIRENSIESSF